MLKLCVCLCCLLLSSSTSSMPEVPNKPPELLRERATHVVTGTIKRIYAQERKEGRWAYTRHLAETRIDSVEKGDDLQKGELIYVRYFERRWTGPQTPADTFGHRGLPKEGDRVRIYLVRNGHNGFEEHDDGGLNVMYPNGFEEPTRDDEPRED